MAGGFQSPCELPQTTRTKIKPAQQEAACGFAPPNPSTPRNTNTSEAIKNSASCANTNKFVKISGNFQKNNKKV